MKTVLVTGGAGGIGSAICRLFAVSGWNIIVHYHHSEKTALDLVKEINSSGGSAVCFSADITNESEVNALADFAVQTFGRIDALVNNAGISSQQLYTDLSPNEMRTMLDVNLLGAMLVTRAIIPGMIHEKYGRIVNISSMWGITGASCEVVYSAAKAGIIGFTKALAKETALSGITVNCVAPGLIDTKMNAHLSADDLSSFIDEIPVGRIGFPHDVANAVYFLCGVGSGYITGATLPVDGGVTI